MKRIPIALLAFCLILLSFEAHAGRSPSNVPRVVFQEPLFKACAVGDLPIYMQIPVARPTRIFLCGLPGMPRFVLGYPGEAESVDVAFLNGRSDVIPPLIPR